MRLLTEIQIGIKPRMQVLYRLSQTGRICVIAFLDHRLGLLNNKELRVAQTFFHIAADVTFSPLAVSLPQAFSCLITC
jgi:hypothetical protein